MLSGFGGLVVSMLAPKIAGSIPAEAFGFLGRKNPQHAFLRRGSNAVCPMSQLCSMLKNPAIWSVITRPYFLLSVTEVSHAVWHGAPLGMNGGTKDEGLEYKRLRRLKCDRRNFRQPHS
jgi:hypothetical protein